MNYFYITLSISSIVVNHLIALSTQSSFIDIKSQLRDSSKISSVVDQSLIKFLSFSFKEMISYIQILPRYQVSPHLSHPFHVYNFINFHGK
jgi:Zn-finger domain-containing protein